VDVAVIAGKLIEIIEGFPLFSCRFLHGTKMALFL
jgi:hypothetical protein